jgi:hypothetical protein
VSTTATTPRSLTTSHPTCSTGSPAITQSEANAIDADTVVAALKRVGRVLPDLTFDITDVAVAAGRARPPPCRCDAHASISDGARPTQPRANIGGVQSRHRMWTEPR